MESTFVGENFGYRIENGSYTPLSTPFSCSRNQFSEILNADGERKTVPLLQAYVIAFVQISLFSSLKNENPSNGINYAMSEKSNKRVEKKKLQNRGKQTLN